MGSNPQDARIRDTPIRKTLFLRGKVHSPSLSEIPGMVLSCNGGAGGTAGSNIALPT